MNIFLKDLLPQVLLILFSFSGLPTEYGLYSSFLGPIVYIFFGSCKEVPMGPSAISALMTFQAVQGRGIEYSILLCFLTGIVQLLMGLFGLGESLFEKYLQIFKICQSLCLS